MKRLSPADYVVMPWKNGRGSTIELYRVSGTDSRLDWRVSIAAVTNSGPFSAFPGYDRHIMVIEGNGMILEGGPEGSISVSPTYVPVSFSGDWDISASLIGSPLTDFNLMSRRFAFSSHLDCRVVEDVITTGESGETSFIHVLSGVTEVDGETIMPRHSMVATLDRPLELRPRGGACRIAICRLRPDQ